MDGAKFGRRIQEFRQLFSIGTYISQFKRIINEPSIYLDMPRKGKYERIKDNIIWLIKNGEVNRYYNTYGLDIKNFRKAADFVPYREFSIRRNDENLKNCAGGNYNGYNRVCILRDKFLFAAFIREAIGTEFAVPVLAQTKNGIANVYPGKSTDVVSYIQERTNGNKKTIFKKVNGECGDGVYLIERCDGIVYINHKPKTIEQFANEICDAEYIVQDCVVQHEELNRINPSCVNTIRYVTIIDDKGKVHTFSHF